MKGTHIPLNPAFADMPTSELIRELESLCVFQSAELERELTARMERLGKCWRFSTMATIEVYYPARQRRTQQPCNIGLFDTDHRSQIDLADL